MNIWIILLCIGIGCIFGCIIMGLVSAQRSFEEDQMKALLKNQLNESRREIDRLSTELSKYIEEETAE